MFSFVRVREKKFAGGNFAAQKFFRQVWGNLGKDPSHPQKLPTSTPMVLTTNSRRAFALNRVGHRPLPIHILLCYN